MITIHLADDQRDTFAACGLIVIDGERRTVAGHPNWCSGNINWAECECWDTEDMTERQRSTVAPEGWRILTEPCDTCDGSGLDIVDSEPDGTQYGFGDCLNPDCVSGRRVVTLTATCPDCGGVGGGGPDGQGGFPIVCERCRAAGVVTLGRFTIPALLPVIDAFAESAVGPWIRPFHALGGYVGSGNSRLTEDDLSALSTFDPLPRPGQFIARPERVQ